MKHNYIDVKQKKKVERENERACSMRNTALIGPFFFFEFFAYCAFKTWGLSCYRVQRGGYLNEKKT